MFSKSKPNSYVGLGNWSLLMESDQINSGIVSLTPRKNILFIFPSWSNHSVDPNLSDEPRISLSFNTGFIQ